MVAHTHWMGKNHPKQTYSKCYDTTVSQQLPFGVPQLKWRILVNDFPGWLGDDVASAVPLLEEASLLGYSCVSKTAASSRVFVRQDVGEC